MDTAEIGITPPVTMVNPVNFSTRKLLNVDIKIDAKISPLTALFTETSVRVFSTERKNSLLLRAEAEEANKRKKEEKNEK